MMSVAISQPLPRSRKTVVKKRSSLDLSVAGLVFCSLMSFMGVAAVNSGANLLYAVFGLSLGILLVSRSIGRLCLRKMSMKRTLPDHAMVGRPLELKYELHNRKRFWPSLSITVAELDGVEAFAMQPHGYLLHVSAGKTATIAAEAMGKRRGLHHLNRCQLITSFPFGFIRRGAEVASRDTLLVYPAVGEVDQSIFQLCRSAESSGAMMRPRSGGSDEFYGVKEFRNGDNPRRIYWRRTAHTGTLVSKEMTHVSPPRLLILADTQLGLPDIESQAAVEKAIAMAASLASVALEQGLPVGLIAWADRWVHIAPNRGKRHRRDILTALARLPRNTTHGAMNLLNEVARQKKSTTTAVLITPHAVHAALAGEARGGLVVLPVDSAMALKGFKFQKTVNFANCIPEERTGAEE